MSTMSNLNRNSINILDLPDEMLCAILNKLNMVDIFYSLANVNQRFQRLALDSIDIHHLNLVVQPLVKRYSCSINAKVLDRICKILPQICDDVCKLTIEPFSLRRVLGIADYPNLHSLSLINFPAERLLSQLTGDTIFVRLLTHQITQLCIDSYAKKDQLTDKYELEVFARIISVGKQLCDVTFNHSVPKKISFVSNFKLPRTMCTSSTLTRLNISVGSLEACLYLLDGRFECLSTLIIEITADLHSISRRGNWEILPRLKCFSLSSEGMTFYYDKEIVLLLRRMPNLEELTLFLVVGRFDSTFVDGKQLHDTVLSSMTQLQKLSFSIHTQVFNRNIEIELPSSNDLRNSFFELGYKDVDAFGDVTFVDNRADAHIYSLPYQFEVFFFMTSAFHGGKFDQVRRLTMFDRRPFEHRLFQIIARDFPFLEKLLVHNLKEQQVKDRSDEYIMFTHLFELDLEDSHTDYVREFLSNEYIILPRLTSLSVTYQTLETVTNIFTDNQARLICNKITHLCICGSSVLPENFGLYFPLLDVNNLKK